jgi:Fe(3+) dicitrate transport protein
MKTIIFLMAILLISSSLVNAQKITDGTIRGKVVDQKGEPLPSVNVGIIGTSKGTITNHNGEFEIIGLKYGVYNLGATYVGYETFYGQVTVVGNNSQFSEIVLNDNEYNISPVKIIGQKEGIFSSIPGSLTIIDAKEISKVMPLSGNELIRLSPGVHVVDEEGVGLRLNVGIRGLDPARSTSVLILEDGIPVALNPYGEPEMYFTPSIDRMSGVEILKGSGSIVYGPQTIGGIINYTTADPPLEAKGSVYILGSQGGLFSGMATFGNSYEKSGFIVNYLHKQASNIGPTAFNINDINSKFRLQLNDHSHLIFKASVYDETSNSTYIGLPQTMYDMGGFDYLHLAPYDNLHIRRYAASAIYSLYLTPKTRLTTSLFGYTTTRNWQRQDFSYNSFNGEGELNPKPSNFSGITWGDEAVAGGAIYMRNGTGNRNRQFEVGGVETRIGHKYSLGNISNDFVSGFRLLYERAFEQRVNGTKPDVSTGDLREEEIRTGYATSAFVHNKFLITNKFSVTAGTRLEFFDYERHILRGTFLVNGQNVLRDTSVRANSMVFQVIPGAGFNYNVKNQLGFFGGIHRGFAPPRIKDAISKDGEAYELDAELSWNYEIGARGKFLTGFDFEVTTFLMDFSNQIIPVSEYIGGVGVGIVNGGKTRHLGVESGLGLNFSKLLGFQNNWYAHINTTITKASFSADRYINHQGQQVNIKGNVTPYAPELLICTSLSYESRRGFGMRLAFRYVGKQYTDLLNTITPSNDGRIGLMPAFNIVDASAKYYIEKINTTINLAVKNLTNERYISTRRPQGIRVGLPRYFMVGLNYEF